MSDLKSLTIPELIKQCYIYHHHPVIATAKFMRDLSIFERALDEPSLTKRDKLLKRAAKYLAEYVVDLEMYGRRSYAGYIPGTLHQILLEIITRVSESK